MFYDDNANKKISGVFILINFLSKPSSGIPLIKREKRNIETSPWQTQGVNNQQENIYITILNH